MTFIERKTFRSMVGALAMLLSSVGAASAVQVTVPGTATGGFGYPNGGYTPFVAAITVTGPGTITIVYKTGTVIYGNGRPAVGPNGGVLGASLNLVNFAYPLDEAVGISTAAYPNKNITHIAALIGAFVPSTRATNPLFQPVDGTKGVAALGIVPSELFFVGSSHVIDVNSAGTLYLGINDNGASDNSGSFVVNVTSP